MAQNSIHIAGFFSKSDISELGYLEKELQQQGISLSVRCLQLEFHTKWDGASYDVGHALSHQVGQLFTASALFTIN